MKDDKNPVLNGIMCDANNCNYNCPGNKCSASSIKVGNHDAQNPSDTECNTFEPKDQ